MLANLKPPGRQKFLWDSQQPGLVVRVGASGETKTFCFHYYDDGGQKIFHRIGRAGVNMNVSRARLKVQELTKYRTEGGDPERDKKQHRESSHYQLGIFITLPEADVPDSQRECIQSAFKQFLDKSMQSFTVERMERWARAKIKSGIKPSTVNRQRAALVAVLNKAVDRGLIEASPLKKWKALKAMYEPRVRYLSPVELVQLDEALNHPDTPAQVAQMVRIWMKTGLRRTELFSLVWGDVYLDDNPRIHIRATKTKSKRDAFVPLTASVVEIFKSIRPEDAKPLDLVFPSPRTGKQYTTIKTAWRGILKRSGLTDLRVHDLRHHCASMLVQKGVSLYQVRDILRHSSITMTEKYSHNDPEGLAAAIAILDD